MKTVAASMLTDVATAVATAPTAATKSVAQAEVILFASTANLSPFHSFYLELFSLCLCKVVFPSLITR